MSSSTFVPASEAQINLVAKLIGERNLETYALAAPAKQVANGTRVIAKSSASTLINELLALPKLEQSAPAASATSVPEVPEGRYAVEQDGTLKFFQVDRPTEGKWAGYTFVKVQASDDLYPLRNKTAREAVLRLIAEAGPEQASIRYGLELGVCGRCGRTLTDESSRAAGIGPVCAAKAW